MAAARYVEMNPVRAGLVAVPWEYPWLSGRFHMGIVEDDALVTDKTLLGLVTDWERFLQAAEDGPMNKLRQATRTGRPAGDGSFVTTVERITGRDLSKGRPGRPRKRPVRKTVLCPPDSRILRRY
jgi:putative transposase